MEPKIPCTVEILTYNSGKSLGRCLESLAAFEEIIVLDGGSTDSTVRIATDFGAEVLSQRADGTTGPIDDFSAVRNRGIEVASNKWFLYIDSDEYVSPELVAEVRKVIESGERGPLVYRAPRQYVLNNVIITQATTYPNYQRRFFYIPATVGFKKKVHEQVQPKDGVSVGTLASPIYVPLETLPELRKKWQKYITIQLLGISLTWGRVYRSIWSNGTKFVKYLLKYLWIFLFTKGEKMPFAYEWENALYHIKLPLALIRKVLA